VVTFDQLLSAGLSPATITRRVQSGRLHRVHRGVYAVGHGRLTDKGRWSAAVLACGGGAVLSHASAAALWGLPWPPRPRVDVTVPRRGGRATRRGLHVHRAPLGRADVLSRDGIPVTSPRRTLVDLADYGDRRALERAWDEALLLGFNLTGLAPHHGKRGSGLLAAVQREHVPGSTRTRSPLEELMLALRRERDLPQPLVNSTVGRWEVDFAWPERRLIVETDGRGTHSTPGAFERDRLKDAELTVAGWRVVRITQRRLEEDPAAVTVQLRRLLQVR
jgi:very-short-patch-repair endonuclease